MADGRHDVLEERARGGSTSLSGEGEGLLEKARRSIDAADQLLRDGNPDFAVSRAYYAMFYAAEALLRAEGLRFGKHSGVHAAFGERFAKSGRLDRKYHRWLLDAFDHRIIGDYGLDAALTTEDVENQIHRAREFLGEAERRLRT